MKNTKIRKHVSLLNGAIFASILILVVVFGLRYYIGFDFGGYFWPWAGSISVAVAILISLIRFSIWKRDYLIIADKRIIYNYQKGIFSKLVVEILYSDITEVSYMQKGLMSSLSKVGDLQIKTASGNLNFRKVKRPEELVELINNIREEYGA